MDLYEFNTLPMQYQAQFTWDYGNFIASRSIETHLINLYQTQKFFIEVYFSLRSEGVDKIVSFTNLDNLEPYLELISIADLYLER